MSFINLEFEFNNIKSSDMGLYIVKIDSGMINSEISGEKSLVSEKIPYNDIPYIYRTDVQPMRLSIIVSPLEGIWTEDFKYKIFNWLNTRIPKGFKSTDYMGKICYGIFTNAQELITTGNRQGYLELNFETTAHTWFSDMEVSTFDFSEIISPTTFTLFNKSNVSDARGNYYYMPEKILIDLKGTATGITITNNSDSGRQSIFTNLSQAESLIIDNRLGRITSSTGLSRLGNFNKNWLRLGYGVNQLVCSSKCILQFHCQYPVYI